MFRYFILFLLGYSGVSRGAGLVYEPSLHSRNYALLEHMEYLASTNPNPPSSAANEAWEKPPALGIADIGLDAAWLRFRIDHRGTDTVPIYLLGVASYTDLIEVYELNADEEPRFLLKAGESVEQSANSYRLPLIPLSVTPGSHTFLLRVSTKGPLNLSFKLWNQASFDQEHRGPESLILGLLFGIVAVMIGYNSFLAYRLRSRSYYLYVLYISAFGVVQFLFTGLAYKMLPESSWKMPLINEGLIYAGEFCAIFAALFAISILELAKTYPRLVKAIQIFIALSAVNMLICPFNFNLSINLIFLTNAYISILLLFAGIRRSIDRYRPAYFYTVAWVFVILGNMLTMMGIYGLLPENDLAIWSQFVGGAFEVVLLSLALGDKIRLEQESAHAEISKLNGDLSAANLKLRQHIENVEAIVEEQTRDIRSIMEHIPLGVFMIRRDGRLHKDHSRLLPEIFPCKLDGTQDAIRLVFSQALMSDDAKHQAINALYASLGELSINFDLNSDLLPTTLSYKRKDQQRTFDITWNVITDEATIVDKVLVTIRDITEIKRLEIQAQDQREELEFIGEILNIPTPRFLRFIQTCRELIFENNRLIHADGIEKRNCEVLKLLFINMHTIKGSARSLYLKRISEIFHGIENYYAHLQKDPHAFWDQSKMERDLEEAKRIVGIYETIAREKLGRSLAQNHTLEFPVSQIELVYRRLSECLRETNLPPETAQDLDRIRSLFYQKIFQDARDVLAEILGCLPILAKDLQKERPLVKLSTGGILLNDRADELFRSIFVHFLRNSMDHGIEAASERRAKAKPEQGTISISLEKKGGKLLLVYADDGRGLHLTKICDIARARNLVSPSASLGLSDIAELIFDSGLSTADRLTDISGRGIGMGAVRSFIEHSGGSIRVLLNPSPGEDPAFRSFQFHVELPFDKFFELSVDVARPSDLAS